MKMNGRRTRAAVFTAALLSFAASAWLCWSNLGRYDTDPQSENNACLSAVNLVSGRQRWGIPLDTPVMPDFTHGQDYVQIPMAKWGVRDRMALRRMPFAISMLAEAALLAAVLSLEVSALTQLWLIIGLSTIFLQPGVVRWAGALSANSYQLSAAFLSLAAAAACRRRARVWLFAAAFVTTWFEFQFLILDFFCVAALRWMIRHPQGSSTTRTSASAAFWDAFSYGGGLVVAFAVHVAQDCLYFGGVKRAYDFLRGIAAASAGFSAGVSAASVGPYWSHIQDRAAAGSVSRWGAAAALGRSFFERGFARPELILTLLAGALSLPWLLARVSGPVKAGRSQLLSLLALALAVCSAFAWALIMPRHLVQHFHVLPGITFFVPLVTVVLAGPLALERRSRPR